MQTVQIRIPEDLIKKADQIIEKGLFRSRSHLLREALTKYLSELSYIGDYPFIVGPFTPEQINILKMSPKKSLSISEAELKNINEKLKDLAM